MRRASAALTVLLLLAGGAACGDDEDPVATGGPPASGAPTDVVISITSGGGFVPYGYDFANVPTLVLRDGTVLVGGAMTMQYPGPALSPVVTGRLSAAEVGSLLDAAEAAGLDEDDLDAGQPGITDSPTTTVVVEIDGERHSNSAYALSYEPEPSSGATQGLTPAQVAVRTAMGGFVRTVGDTATRVATERYEPTAYRVIAQPIDPAGDDGQDIQPNDLDWPLADVPLPGAADARCIDIDGERTAPFAAALREATQITRWHTADGGTFSLSIRATLPGDEPCSAAK